MYFRMDVEYCLKNVGVGGLRNKREFVGGESYRLCKSGVGGVENFRNSEGGGQILEPPGII